MYEHGLIPSDYTERPIYQKERSLDLQCELYLGLDMVDDILRLPSGNGVTINYESLEGGIKKISRSLSYNHPQHQELVSLRIEHETLPTYNSEVYSIAVEVNSLILPTADVTLTTNYVLQKNGDNITSAFIQSADLERGGLYKDRQMTLYDARQLFNELAEFSVAACQDMETE